VVGTSRWHVRGLAELGHLVKLTDIGHLVEAKKCVPARSMIST
jgi:hypothetical protein